MICRRWFHSKNSSEAAKVLLEQGYDGSFLIRPSANFPGNYTLSARCGDIVRHVQIMNEGDYYYMYGDEIFATLSELVQYYTEQILPTADGELVRLIRPLYTVESVQARWYHGNISKSEVQKLLEEKPDGTFLVRESVTQPGCFVLSIKTPEDIMNVLIHNKDGGYYIPGEGSPPTFTSLPELIEYYNDPQHPLFGCNKVPYVLQQAAHSTRLNVVDISERTNILDTSAETEAKSGYFEEFNLLDSADDKQTFERKVGTLDENRPKNRYKNILPFDHSRVVLHDATEQCPISDYINANYISTDVDGVRKTAYIATQGCLPRTVVDLWRMVWQENSCVIVNLTKPMEKGKNKCAVYWTEKGEASKVFELPQGARLTLTSIQSINKGSYVMRELELSKFRKQDDRDVLVSSKTIYLFHFIAWPDKSVPTDPGPLLDFTEQVNQCHQALPSCGPIVVHCSAGIGRTGAWIVLDMIVGEIKKKGLQCEIDVMRTVQKIRSQRSGMVQTVEQYRFIYQSIKYYMDSASRRLAAPHVGVLPEDSNYGNLYAQMPGGRCAAQDINNQIKYENAQ